MHTNHYEPEEYPHSGYFYKLGVDESKPLDEQIEEEMIIFETKFDLSEGSDLEMKSFKIYFPFDYKKELLTINEGNTFKGLVFGASIKGRVLSIYPSQFGGCTVLLTRI